MSETTIIDRTAARLRRPSRRNPVMNEWVDPVSGVRVMFDSMHLDSCCPHESWWLLTGDDTRKFRVEGPIEFAPRLEPFFWNQPATSAMTDAWARFCRERSAA